jgi:sortase A
MRRIARIGGTLMIVAGLLTVVWVALVWQWQDPFTALYTKYQQHKLASTFSHRFAEYRPPASVRPVTTLPDGTVSVAAERRNIRLAAAAYRRNLREGEPVGRLIVPRLGLKSIVVNGTSHDDLTKGPGRELHTYMPGQDELIYIAGHRTTYLAPFAHIDSLRPGDPITFELPYGTFHYEVTGHEIVPADDLAVLRTHHKELLTLQACHPRFFATHRYLAYAKLVRVEPRNGKPYTLVAASPHTSLARGKQPVSPARPFPRNPS